jgi:hypothetical protein
MKISGSMSRLRMLETQDLAAAQAEAYRLMTLRKDLQSLRDRQESLTLRAPFGGQIIAPNIERVKGRFLQLGDTLFTVASLDKLRVTAVVDNNDITEIKRLANGVKVRIKFLSAPRKIYIGTIDRVHPSATTAAPPVALMNAAGGPVLMDPKAADKRRTLLPWNRVDIVLDPDQVRPPVGTTGRARFVVGEASLIQQGWTRFRRMLNRRFLTSF